LILWTDDDVMVDSNWMTTYYNAALDFPEAVFFAGTIDPWITQALPAWIKPHFKEMNAVYAVNQHGEENRPFAKGDAVIGANMGFRTDVLRRFPFSSRLGSRGDTILIGEETELWHRLSHAGYKGMWLGKAKVRHFIRPERLTKAYVARWYKGIGRSMVLRGYFQEGKTLLGYSRWALLQRCKHKLCAGFYLPFHGPRWFHSFRQAAILGGVLYELRQHTPLEEAPPSKIVLTDSPASTTRWDHQAVQQRT
jgi:GT2 family glycosyltransferase